MRRWTSRRLLAIALLAWPAAAASAADAKAVADAERAAAAALELLATRPADALAQASKALGATGDFEPTAFVKSGRKGEVVEDAYLEARAEYRRHRARLYAAVGDCQAANRNAPAALRYLRRAFLLDKTPEHALALARAYVAAGRGREALEALVRGTVQASPEALAVAGQAVDVAGLPSLQAEIDRARVLALPRETPAQYRDGPFEWPEKARLSTGVVADLQQDGVTIVYNAEASCKTCSADLEILARVAGRSARVWLSAESRDVDRALRQAVSIYRYDWPFVVGGGVAGTFSLPSPSIFLVARRAFVGVVVPPPFTGLAPALDLLRKADVNETLPRANWLHRPADRRPLPPPPGLLPEGLAPGEDEPAPEAFTKAVAAYAAGRPREALALFEQLEAKGDGWLLPPEARLNRGLCLIAMGQHETARLLLLKTGDSRFQDDVDKALDRAGSPGMTKPR